MKSRFLAGVLGHCCPHSLFERSSATTGIRQGKINYDLNKAMSRPLCSGPEHIPQTVLQAILVMGKTASTFLAYRVAHS
eukprot:scaffold74168_cov20-Tisochrysis_lutea.AAC.1